jgi:hypothetical protein
MIARRQLCETLGNGQDFTLKGFLTRHAKLGKYVPSSLTTP